MTHSEPDGALRRAIRSWSFRVASMMGGRAHGVDSWAETRLSKGRAAPTWYQLREVVPWVEPVLDAESQEGVVDGR